MRARFKQSGLTLMEQVVVIAAIALLVVFGLPAVRTFFKSIESRGGARAMINAGLSSARAIAARQQHYAGIRFQHAYHHQGLLKAPQYMIFIMHDPQMNPSETIANGFRAFEGMEPIKLPDNVGVMEVVNSDGEIDDDDKLTDKTAFSIIFSPSGKLVIHKVRIRNRDGQEDSPSYGDSLDDIFNKKTEVEAGIAMFYQDDYPSEGLDEEQSKNSFIIYDRDIFEKVDENNRWSDYLNDLDVIHINPYTGTMINR